MLAYVLLFVCTYIRMFEYVLACILTYFHLFPLSIGGKGCDDGRKCKKGRMGEGWGNGLLQSEFLFLSNFIVAKGLFWFD